ncbi:MAG: tetraacyldisaccharide 4'-kinase [Odoribacter splanchnicus]
MSVILPSEVPEKPRIRNIFYPGFRTIFGSLSERGYKRQTSGFQLATPHSNAEEIGDEPLQIKHKFPKVIVAVDENRVRGIEHLLALPERPEVIILDDAFQHRSVKAGKNIVLVDYNRPVFKDCLLPAGRLRETPKGLKRADYIIVSKCPPTLTPIEKRILFKHLKIKPYQQLFFTHQQYGPIRDIMLRRLRFIWIKILISFVSQALLTPHFI